MVLFLWWHYRAAARLVGLPRMHILRRESLFRPYGAGVLMGSNPRLAPWAALLRRCAAQDDIGVRTGGSKIRPYVVRCGCMGAGFFAAVFLARLIILEMHRSLG